MGANSFATRGRRRAILAATLLGALAALGQAPVGAWPLSVIAFAGILGLLRAAPHPRRAALIGWAAGLGYFLAALAWIVEPFLVDVARHGWMAPFALGFMAAGLALFWGGAGWLAHRAGGTALALIAAFTLAEALRGRIFTGFPWAQPGHIWVDTPLLQLAAFGGALSLTAATILLALLIWQALLGNRWALATALLVQAALLVAPSPQGPRSDEAPIVRLIQPNAAQHEKWKPEMIPVFFRRQLGFTGAPPQGNRRAPSLIVWPETAIPDLLNYATDILNVIGDIAGEATVVLGAQRIEGMRLYNSLAVLGADGALAHVYDKHHLVPFGEYVPFGDLLGRVGISGLAARTGNGYSAGPGPELIDLGPLGLALPLICYEGVFPRNISGAPARADLLLLITNDAWFGELSGPYQHLAQARLRAAEQGLPMIRVANTGVSAMIDARGAIVGALPLGKAGYADVPLPPPLPPTLYARMGDLPILLLLALGLGGAWATRRQRRPVSD
ncbi:apolipoprotein N-acyltransferase [Roseovarius faecimaris]|uniref:Apolipoprotein N-acyltransferase n=2 Tax=Roseovarius faecimaris TaxID=2494550 RepID=A0A6I6J6I9_9RHOB|nr:apolipoprotein N-acyltransferase [Roseovarius faecimaris]QGY00389.1 apolipoprotein N-acyltransferase [Roseovarius faecimaris]